MENFTLHNPTRLHFGRGQISRLSEEVPENARVFLLAGGGSIKANGVYDQVMKALGKRNVREFWGIEANPDYDTLMKAVEICRKEKIDFLLAVGGGSVIDGAKFVAAAVHFEGEPWDILVSHGSAISKPVLPIGSVLTLPAAGSEANSASVISRRAITEKLAFMHPTVYPKFSVIDPEVTFSLPLRQVANGIADAFTHVMEQYLTYPANAAVQDRFAESILRVLVDEGTKTYQNPKDYDARANLVWAATCALSGQVGAGVPQDWATHMIGHEITALHGIDHARTLALVLPSLLELEKEARRAKLVQYAERVWDVREGSDDEKVAKAIAATRSFYENIGIPTRLSAYQIPPETAVQVGQRLSDRGMQQFGDRNLITPAKVTEILRRAA